MVMQQPTIVDNYPMNRKQHDQGPFHRQIRIRATGGGRTSLPMTIDGPPRLWADELYPWLGPMTIDVNVRLRRREAGNAVSGDLST
jgi:hypothetical protein